MQNHGQKLEMAFTEVDGVTVLDNDVRSCTKGLSGTLEKRAQELSVPSENSRFSCAVYKRHHKRKKQHHSKPFQSIPFHVPSSCCCLTSCSRLHSMLSFITTFIQGVVITNLSLKTYAPFSLFGVASKLPLPLIPA